MKTVDISDKGHSKRAAAAEGRLTLKPGTIKEIEGRTVRKGDPFKIAEPAVLLAVKRTSELIPHCHPIPVSAIDVEFSIDGQDVVCLCEVRATYSTGVEMEALTGTTVGLLTVWDVVKYLEKDVDGQYQSTRIHGLRVVRKTKTPAKRRGRGR